MRELRVKGMAHTPGGGLVEKVPRMLPRQVRARLERARWERPPIFDWLQARGNVTDAEMHRVFNCGIGMAVVVAAEDAEHAVATLVAAGGRAVADRESGAPPAPAPPAGVPWSGFPP